MAFDFVKAKKADIVAKLTAAGVEVPAAATKEDLVGLAKAHPEAFGEAAAAAPAPVASVAPSEDPGNVAAAPAPVAAPAAPKADVVNKELAKVTLDDLGLSPSGIFELVCVNPSAVPDSRCYRVFGPEGQFISPVFAADQSGEGARIREDQNTHLQHNIGNTKFNALKAGSQKKGF